MHFNVLIIGGNYEKQLAPFDVDFRTTFCDMTEEYKKEYDTKTIEIVEMADGKRFSIYSDEVRQYKKPKNEDDKFEKHFGEKEWVLPEGAALKSIPFNEFYKTFEEFVDDWENAIKNGRRYGYWHNPRAEWDWHTMGKNSRWPNHLPLKDGTTTYEALWGDIDTDKLQPTLAVLKNGRWYSGGWEIISDKHALEIWTKKFKKLIQDIDPETEVGVVDCHI